ncbi:unnamed protein product, partial [Effrenium voratum]
ETCVLAWNLRRMYQKVRRRWRVGERCVLFSFAPNMIHASVMLSSGQSVAFVADNLLLLFNSGIQVKMCQRVRKILDEALPDWRNQMTGTGSGEPLLQAERAAPRAARTGPFQPFAGSGQRLGAAG